MQFIMMQDYKTLLLAVSFLVICPVLRKKMPKPDLVQN